MGWTYTSKPANVKEYLNNLLTWNDDNGSRKVLDSAIVSFSEYYAIVEHTKDDEKSYFLATFMIRFNKSYDYNFGYKSMTEDMGPYMHKCPISMLDKMELLNPSPGNHAADFRRRCRDYHKARNAAKTVKNGSMVTFDNLSSATYEAVKQGRKTRFKNQYGQLYNVQGWRDRVVSVS